MKYIFWVLTTLFFVFFWIFFVSENNFVFPQVSENLSWEKNISLSSVLTGDTKYISRIFLVQKNFEISSEKCLKSVSLNWTEQKIIGCKKNLMLTWNIGYNDISLSIKEDWWIKNFSVNQNIISYLFVIIIFLSLLLIFSNSSKQIKFFSLIILFFSTRFFLISNIDYRTYSRDYDWHMEYINYIKDNFSLPAPTAWQTHQLPWYYYISWAVSKIAENIWINQYFSLQLLAVLLSAWTIFFFFKILDFFSINEKNKFLIAVLMISFWWIWINTIKIWNDPASYFGFMGWLYFLLVRGKNPTYNKFLPVILWTILAIYMKKTNMLVLPLLAIFVTYVFINRENFTRGNEHKITQNFELKKFYNLGLKKYLILWFSSLFLVFVSLLPRLIHLKKYNINFLDATPGSVKVADRLKVENKPSRYYIPSVLDFFKIPYTSTWDDKLGRNNFWEFLIKTGFWWEFQYKKNIQLMQVIMLVTCLIGLITLIYFFLNFWSFWFLWVGIFLWIISLLYFFFWHTYACNQDFRYILPAGFLWIIIFASVMQKYKLQYLTYFLIFLNFIFMVSRF